MWRSKIMQKKVEVDENKRVAPQLYTQVKSGRHFHQINCTFCYNGYPDSCGLNKKVLVTYGKKIQMDLPLLDTGVY